MKSLDVVIPDWSLYSVLDAFSQELSHALERQGIRSKVHRLERAHPGPCIQQILKTRPDAILCFNGMLSDEFGNFLFDQLQIPWIPWLVDSAARYCPVVQSPYSIVPCVDRQSVQFLEQLGFPRAFFLPIAASPCTIKENGEGRPIDVLVLSSAYSPEQQRKGWQKRYPPEVCAVMEAAAERLWEDPDVSFPEALTKEIDYALKQGKHLYPKEIPFLRVIHELELFLMAKGRIETVRAIKDAHVLVVGGTRDETSWKKELGKIPSNITIREAVPFHEALQLISQAKILLSSCAWIRDGMHDRVAAGYAAKTLVITEENPYLKEQFDHDHSIVFYRYNNLKALNETANYYLKHNTLRESVAANGRKIVLARHTWDTRAQELLEKLPEFLARIRPQLSDVQPLVDH